MNGLFGAVVGRFQCSYLTSGHIALIDKAYKHHDKVIIFVGVLDSPPNAKNPLSFRVREEMILDQFPDAVIIPTHDHESDVVWSNNLDFLVDTITNHEGAIFYVGRDSFSSHYTTKKYPIIHCDFGIDDISATKFREGLAKNTYNSVLFRAGIIYAHQNLWHRTHSTVDMALVKPVWGGVMMVLVRKPGESQWQLPGGFVNAGELYADAAEREMQEECHLGSDVGWKMIQDVYIDDWRVRNTPYLDHKTHLMIGFSSTNTPDPVADDDIEEAKWFWVDHISKNIEKDIKSGHRKLVELALEEIDKHFNR